MPYCLHLQHWGSSPLLLDLLLAERDLLQFLLLDPDLEGVTSPSFQYPTAQLTIVFGISANSMIGQHLFYQVESFRLRLVVQNKPGMYDWFVAL